MSIRGLRNVAFAVLILVPGLFAADSPFVGTWKLNVAKSKLAGSGLGENATFRIEADGDGQKASVEAINEQGQPLNFTFRATLDGKPGTVTGSPTIDTISLQRVNDHTLRATGKKGGKVIYMDRRVVSSDGKTLTISRTGTNAQGQKYQATIVFEKQPLR